MSASLLSLSATLMCVCVGREGEEYSYYPCKTIEHGVRRGGSVREMELVYSSSGHEGESKAILFHMITEYLIEGREGGESSKSVEKGVREIIDVLFTLKYCENITFSSIAFTITSSSLSPILSSLHSTLISFSPAYHSTHSLLHSLHITQPYPPSSSLIIWI